MYLINVTVHFGPEQELYVEIVKKYHKNAYYTKKMYSRCFLE